MTRAHREGRCGINCDDCDGEIFRDEQPGGQCYEGTCFHDDCIETRALSALDDEPELSMTHRAATFELLTARGLRAEMEAK
jgi:hypothetical protein